MIEQVETLEEVLEPRVGQTVFCNSDQKIYQWSPVEGWEEIHPEANITMKAYEMNKQIVGQLEVLDEEAMEEKKKAIRDFVYNWNHQFYMLLCRELNYYTVFYINPELAIETVEDMVIECAHDIGDIKAIDKTQDDCAIEIWITNCDNETYVMYFFPYENGVIVCG